MTGTDFDQLLLGTAVSSGEQQMTLRLTRDAKDSAGLGYTVLHDLRKWNDDEKKWNRVAGPTVGFVEEQYGRAEIYLKRSLASRPDEPAALNNLAIALLRQGRYAEAETNALHALRVLPDSPAVKKTVDAIREKAKAAPSP